MTDDMFRSVEAALRVIRFEEATRIHSLLYDMAKSANEWMDDEPMRAKHEDRELTHKEVWQRALHSAMLEVDERITMLSQG